MRLIRFLLISAVILSGLVTAISLLLPSTVIVSRAVEVNANQEVISYFVSDLAHWDAWMAEWKENKVTFKDSTAFIGTQSIQPIGHTDSSATFNWVATGQAPYQVQLEWLHLKESTYVIHWSFEQHVKWYPWEKFQTLLNEKLLGTKMELGLASLKEAIDNKMLEANQMSGPVK
jgi:hypothetical protein